MAVLGTLIFTFTSTTFISESAVMYTLEGKLAGGKIFGGKMATEKNIEHD